MKKLIIIPAIIFSLTAISQTYESKHITSVYGYDKQRHTITVTDKTVNYDGVSFNVTKEHRQRNGISVNTYNDSNGTVFCLIYKKGFIKQISVETRKDGLIHTIVLYRPKLKR